jgi:hypothetical protein
LAVQFSAVPGRELEWEQLRTFLFMEKKPTMIRMALRDEN